MTPSPVRPELVEGPFFSFHTAEEGQGFDTLSPNGVGYTRYNEVLA
jgi:hypothetical protein